MNTIANVPKLMAAATSEIYRLRAENNRLRELLDRSLNALQTLHAYPQLQEDLAAATAPEIPERAWPRLHAAVGRLRSDFDRQLAGEGEA